VIEAGVIEVFIKASNSSVCTKVVSKLYHGLRQASTQNSLYIKQKWEKETNNQISKKIWSEVCTFQRQISCGYDIVADIFRMEKKINISLRLQESKLEEIWEMWRRNISSKFSVFV